MIEGAPAGATVNYSVATPATVTSGVGDYPIVVTLGSNPNYNVTAVDSVLSITPRPAQIQPKSGLTLRVYGDPLALGANDVFVTGAANGDTLTFTVKTTATDLSPVGDYSLWIEPGSNPNYSVAVIPGTLRITRRPATVTAVANSKEYGAAEPALVAVGSGFLPGDSVTVTALRAPGESAGAYLITAHASGAAVGNYDVAEVGATFTITKRAASVTANAKSKTYGDPNPVLDAIEVGVLPGDTLVYAVETTASAASGVGTYPISVTPGVNPNYSVTFTNALLTVGARPATVTAGSGTKVYGTANPVIAASGTGFVPGDAIVLTGTRVAGENVGSYVTSVAVSGAAAGNYSLTQVGGTLGITPAPATVTANGATKMYGDANPSLTAVAGGLVGGDTLNYTLQTTADTTSGIGAYPITVSLGANPNYAVTAAGSTLTVTPRAVTVTADTVSKVYGSPDALTYHITSGSLASGDAFTGALTRAGGETVAGGPVTPSGSGRSR